jgi:TonB family protein
MRSVNEQLELGADDEDPFRLQQKLKKALLKEPVVIVIDEAQDLSNAVLEQVRLISNFETPRAKLLQIVLSGQTQLVTQLAHPDLLQLRQRLSIICGLRPLSALHTAKYIEHRLKVAGWSENPVFSRGAIEEIARLSGGVPRLINNICFNALSVGFASRLRIVDIAQVREGAADLRLIGETPTRSASGYIASKIASGKVAVPQIDKVAVPPIDIDKAHSKIEVVPANIEERPPVPLTAQPESTVTSTPPPQQDKGNVTPQTTSIPYDKKSGERKAVARNAALAFAALALLFGGFFAFRFVHRSASTGLQTVVTAHESSQPTAPPSTVTVVNGPTVAGQKFHKTKTAPQIPLLIYAGTVQERNSAARRTSAIHNADRKTPLNSRLLPAALAANPSASRTEMVDDASALSLPSSVASPPHAWIKSKVAPEYPGSALAHRVGGWVVLDVNVSDQGTVEQVRLIQGNGLFRDAAIQAIHLWKFVPARMSGKPVNSWNRVRFTFRPPATAKDPPTTAKESREPRPSEHECNKASADVYFCP